MSALPPICDSCGRAAIHTCPRCNMYSWCANTKQCASSPILHNAICYDAQSTDTDHILKHLEHARQAFLSLPVSHIGAVTAHDDADAIEALQESMLDSSQPISQSHHEWIQEAHTGKHSGLEEILEDVDTALDLAREGLEHYSHGIESLLPLIDEEQDAEYHRHIDRMADLFDSLNDSLPVGAAFSSIDPLHQAQLIHLIGLPRRLQGLRRKAKRKVRKVRVARGKKKIASSKKKIEARRASKKRYKEKSEHFTTASQKKGFFGFTTYRDPKTGSRRLGTKRGLRKKSESYAGKAGKMSAAKKRQKLALARREEKLKRREGKLRAPPTLPPLPPQVKAASPLVPIEYEEDLDHHVMLEHMLRIKSPIMSAFHPEDKSWLTLAHDAAGANCIRARLLTPGGRAALCAQSLTPEQRDEVIHEANNLIRQSQLESRIEGLQEVIDTLCTTM